MFRMIKTVLLTLPLLLASLVSCGRSQQGAAFQTITPAEVYQLQQDSADVLMIDVRTPGEYVGELGHVQGTLLRPLQTIDQWSGEFEKYKDKQIVMICRSGNRSGVASRYFVKKGFGKVFNMAGGMRAWNAAGLPVEKEIPAETR